MRGSSQATLCNNQLLVSTMGIKERANHLND